MARRDLHRYSGQEMIDISKVDSRQDAGWIVDRDRFPILFPTHAHPSEFWEHLGRTIATFGFLEEMLRKAILVFTGTQTCPDHNSDEALASWTQKLEIVLTAPLGNLIDMYAKSVRENPNATMADFDSLVEKLEKASSIRNALCHGSWRLPDAAGASLPLFVKRKLLVFDTAIDIQFLRQVQKEVAELACDVMDTVTCIGWQFPGSAGPGRPAV